MVPLIIRIDKNIGNPNLENWNDVAGKYNKNVFAMLKKANYSVRQIQL